MEATTPDRSTPPVEGCVVPATIRSSVDLPAPFSPISPRDWPAGQLEGDLRQRLERLVLRPAQEELLEARPRAVVEAVTLRHAVDADRRGPAVFRFFHPLRSGDDAIGSPPTRPARTRTGGRGNRPVPLPTPYVQRRRRAMTSPPRISATLWVLRSPIVSFS